MLNISRPLGGRSELLSLISLLHTGKGALLCRIHVCDLPEMYESLRTTYEGNAPIFCRYRRRFILNSTDIPGITVFRDGHGVSRTSDLIIYSVEAESINKVVAQFGPCKRCRRPVLQRI